LGGVREATVDLAEPLVYADGDVIPPTKHRGLGPSEGLGIDSFSTWGRMWSKNNRGLSVGISGTSSLPVDGFVPAGVST